VVKYFLAYSRPYFNFQYHQNGRKKILSSLRIEENFLNLEKDIYVKPTANIINKNMMKVFPLRV
jgi:hypothetical protein